MEALAALVFGLTRTPVWMFGVALAVLFVLSPRFDFQYEGWQMHGSQTQLTLAAIMLYAILRGIRYVISRAGKLRGQQTSKIDVRFWEEALADRMLRQVFWWSIVASVAITTMLLLVDPVRRHSFYHKFNDIAPSVAVTAGFIALVPTAFAVAIWFANRQAMGWRRLSVVVYAMAGILAARYVYPDYFYGMDLQRIVLEIVVPMSLVWLGLIAVYIAGLLLYRWVAAGFSEKS